MATRSSIYNCKIISNTDEEILDTERRLRFSQDIACALQYIHVNGIVHLDVKPSNVLVTYQDRCKLGDFGCCQVLDGGECACVCVSVCVLVNPRIGANSGTSAAVRCWMEVSVWYVCVCMRASGREAVQRAGHPPGPLQAWGLWLLSGAGWRLVCGVCVSVCVHLVVHTDTRAHSKLQDLRDFCLNYINYRKFTGCIVI